MNKKKLSEQEILQMFPSIAKLKADLEGQGIKVHVSGTQTDQTVQSDNRTVSVAKTVQKEGRR